MKQRSRHKIQRSHPRNRVPHPHHPHQEKSSPRGKRKAQPSRRARLPKSKRHNSCSASVSDVQPAPPLQESKVVSPSVKIE